MGTDRQPPARPALRYHGGKWRLAPWLVSMLPPHKIYVEPFCGAASVLMRKPRSYAEVINDLDGDVVNLFAVLRDRGRAEELARQVSLTPFSDREFRLAYEPCEDPVERARRTLVRAFMGFTSGSVNPSHVTGFRGNSFRSGTTASGDWANYPAAIPAFVNRLSGVVVRNIPAVDLIRSLDREDALIYVDPPYPVQSRHDRAAAGVYVHEMSDDDHRDLADVLGKTRAMVVLSGYRCPLFDELYGDWQAKDRQWFADGGGKRTETVWMNRSAAKAAMPLLGFAGG